MTRGYTSWFQGLINVWTMPATMLKNKVMYRQLTHSVAFVNLKCCTCLRPLYLYFPDTPLICKKRALAGQLSVENISNFIISDTRFLVADNLS